jgi:anti-anti-sigma regulatory factor
MATFLLEDKGLVATGRLGIQDASRLKELLMEAYLTREEVQLDLSGAESVDLACMQVLCSANRSFREAGKPFCLAGMLPEGVRRSLEEIGIEPEGCALEASGECLWQSGAGDE